MPPLRTPAPLFRLRRPARTPAADQALESCTAFGLDLSMAGGVPHSTGAAPAARPAEPAADTPMPWLARWRRRP